MKNFLSKSSDFCSTPISAATFWLFCLVFVLFPLGQLTRTYFGGGAMYAHEVVMLLILLLQAKVLAQKMPTLLSQLQKSRYLTFRIFIVWLTVGVALSFFRNFDLTQVLYLVRIGIYLLFIWTAHIFFSTKKIVLRVLLLLTGVWYTWLALLQYFFIPDTRFLWIFGWDDHYYRMIGTLFDPGLTGILLILSFLVSYSLWKQLPRLLTAGIISVTLASVVLTYSRASYLSAVVMILLLIFMEYTKRKGLVNVRKLLIAGTALLLSIGGIYSILPKPGGEGVNLLRTSTVQARLTTASSTLETMLPIEWVIGSGLFSTTLQPDNIFITLFSQTGIIGLLLAAIVGAQLTKKLWDKAPMLAIGLIAVVVQSQFNNTILHPYIIFYLGIFIASYDLRTTLRSTST